MTSVDQLVNVVNDRTRDNQVVHGVTASHKKATSRISLFKSFWWQFAYIGKSVRE